MENLKKKILLLSTSDSNGAYEAIFKLARFFKEEGHQTILLVKTKTQNQSFVVQYNQNIKKNKTLYFFKKIKNKIISRLNFKWNKIVFDSKYSFISKNEKTINISYNQILKDIGFVPDLIFTGMTNDFVNSSDILLLQQMSKAKVYNIAVDMNHFTGGCHYAWDCKGYINGCDSKCPAIISDLGKNLAKNNFETKYKNAKKGDFKVIAMSSWTQNQAKVSKIYENQEIIPNINSMIDTKILNNHNRLYAKDIFNLEKDKFYILMGCQNSNDKRKGFDYLVNALNILEQKLNIEQKNKIEIIIVSRQINTSFDNISFKKKHLEYIKDYRLLSLLYQATDVFVNSSIEDSGPMMVSEALACGTPVVGFDMGVVNNMVINFYNGYKAKIKDSEDLALGIKTIFELTDSEYKKYSDNAVKQVEEYSSFETLRNLKLTN